MNRLEWWYKGRPFAVRYVFADTGTVLPEGFAAQHASRRIRTTSDLGEPDATTAVRIDGRALNPPFDPSGYEWRPL